MMESVLTLYCSFDRYMKNPPTVLMRTASQSLTEQLAAHFAERIADRLLAAGQRLPSVRQCAQQHGVSAATVVAAYDRLLAQGLVEARPQRGFFVREQRVGPLLSTVRAAGAARAPVDAAALMRGMFHGTSELPQPGIGVFPPDWLASDIVVSAVRRVVTRQALVPLSLQYGEPAGDPGLRQALSHKLVGMNVPAAPEQIITTVGATHALDIVSRTLLRAGDHVMVEEPGWAIEFARLQALGAVILPVPRGPEGPDLAIMARYCEAHAPKLFVSVSVLHNPTGYCLSPGSAHRVLTLAAQHGFYIVEDDTYSHLAPDHATRLSALDGLSRTVYVSGFAKILAPGWRVGYLAAPPALVDRFLDTKLLATLTTPALQEQAMAWCITLGALRRQAQRVVPRLDQARARSVKLARAAGCRFVSEPAGLFGWVDTGVDTELLAQRMLDEGYLLAPGALFHAGRKPGTLMRINFATTQAQPFWKVFERLRASLQGPARAAA